MKTYQQIKFSELLDDQLKVGLKKGQLYSFVPMENVETGKKYPRNIETKIFNGGGSRFADGDTLFARITPCLQNKKIVKVKNLENGIGFGSTEFFVFRAKEGVADSDFLYYTTKRDDLINTAILSMVGASGRQRADVKSILDYQVFVPDLPTQTRIASVLSAYDDLIENNEKRIKALEEMAQLLYTEWFVKFKFPGHEKVKLIDSGTEYSKIPEGWEVKKLGDLIQIKKGKNITKETVSKGEIPVVAGGLEPAYFHDTPNTKSPVVTISASGANAGFTRLYFEDVWASDCSFVDLGVTPYVYFYYLFLINRQADISRLQRGSAQPHVYPKDLMELNIIDPTEKVIKDFNDKVATLFQLIGGVRRKNQTLSKTRDLLIPQLVTGKRELKNI